MLKMPDIKAKFFSVKHSTKIQGVHYIPSVCYPLPSELQAVVKEMAAKDMARMYPEKVRFVTGVPYPVRKPAAGAAAPEPSSASGTVKPVVQGPPVMAGKTGQKLGRKGSAAQAGREFD
jgi:hypothetical protein